MEKQDVIKALLPAYSKKAEKTGYAAGDSPYPDSPLAAFHKGGEFVFSLMPDGEIHFKPDTPYRSEVMDLNNTLMEMQETYGIFLNAEPLPIEDVSNFRLFNDYGNHLMAARMEPDSSLHFVTWLYDYDRKGVTLGHYYGDNYAGAKHDFALRTGLVSENKLFTEEELVVLHDACAFRGKNDDEISFDDEKKLQDVMVKIGDNIPNLLFDRHTQQESDPAIKRIISSTEFQQKLTDALLEEACRQWCCFVDEAPERLSGEGFAYFHREICEQKLDEYAEIILDEILDETEMSSGRYEPDSQQENESGMEV